MGVVDRIFLVRDEKGVKQIQLTIDYRVSHYFTTVVKNKFVLADWYAFVT
jgi:hypothetical protein